MSTPNDPSDPNPSTPEQPGASEPFANPGPSSARPPYGSEPQPPYGSQPEYGAQPPYGSQPEYGSQPPYGSQPGYGSPSYGSGSQPPYTPGGSTPSGTPGKNGFGLAALIVGGVALVLSFIPVVNYVSGVIALVGLVLGIVGLVLKNRTKGLAIAGTIVSAIALVLSIVLAVVYTVGFTSWIVNDVTERLPDSSAFPSDGSSEQQDVEVVYEVAGAGTDVSIVYFSFSEGDDSDVQTIEAQSLPWTEEFDATIGGEFDLSTFSVTATNGAEDTGEISCTITVDGEVVAEDSSDGEFGTVSCFASNVLD